MINIHPRDATEAQNICDLGYSSVGGYTTWGRTHLKVALKHYFIKVRLLPLSDLGYWFVGEQQGTEQVEDKEVIFFFF